MFEGIQMLINHFGFIFFSCWGIHFVIPFSSRRKMTLSNGLFTFVCIALLVCFAFRHFIACLGVSVLSRGMKHTSRNIQTQIQRHSILCVLATPFASTMDRKNRVCFCVALCLYPYSHCLRYWTIRMRAFSVFVCIWKNWHCDEWFITYCIVSVSVSFLWFSQQFIRSVSLSLSLHSSRSIHSSLTPGKSYEFEREMILKWKPQHHLLNNFECYVLKHRHLASVIEITMLKLAAHKPSC